MFFRESKAAGEVAAIKSNWTTGLPKTLAKKQKKGPSGSFLLSSGWVFFYSLIGESRTGGNYPVAATKKEHYVPQFYLSYFTTDGERLFVYDKFTRKTFRANKTDIAHENYFYEIPSKLISPARRVEGIDEKFIEKGLAELEGRFFKPALDEINNLPDDQQIPSEVLQAMSVFLTVQILRTKDMRNQIIEGERASKQSIADTLVKLNFPDVPKGTVTIEFKEEFGAFIQAQYIFDMENLKEMSESFYRMIWVVGVNRTNHPFYTSDNPVARYNHIHGVGNGGWLSPGVEIHFPLSPTGLLMLYERTHFNEYEILDSLLVPVTVEQVEKFNKFQITRSYRQIYSTSDDFSLAERICEENPEICRPREKVQVDTSELIETDNPNQLRQIFHIHGKDIVSE